MNDAEVEDARQHYLADLAAAAGVTWFDYQHQTFDAEAYTAEPQRACLYYRTGAGKSITSLVLMAQWGAQHVLVVSPPSTHDTWVAQGERLNIEVECVSHAKFRMKDFKVARNQAIVADEMHLFGGHGGKGWKKLDSLARGLTAPLILASATPSYNDAERVYCVQHILDPHSCKGGFLEFLYRHCETEQDPFSQTPKVLGFWKYPDAESFLADLPHVHYVPDEVVYSIVDIPLPVAPEPALDEYGYNRYQHRMMASIIEERHTRIFIALVDPNGYLNDEAFDQVCDLIDSAQSQVLVFANHSTVADALSQSLRSQGGKHVLVTGKTTMRRKVERIDAFRAGQIDVLVGTASLATGTDGLDKVCDRLIILDDTDDDSLRRQLIGRIMPRGADVDASNKRVYRIVPTWV